MYSKKYRERCQHYISIERGGSERKAVPVADEVALVEGGGRNLEGRSVVIEGRGFDDEGAESEAVGGTGMRPRIY